MRRKTQEGEGCRGAPSALGSRTQQEQGPEPAGGQGSRRGKSRTSGFPEALRAWTQTKRPWDQGLLSRAQMAWGYVGTGSFKRINTPIINFQIHSSLKSMCWRYGGGQGGRTQLNLLPTCPLTPTLTRYKQNDSFTPSQSHHGAPHGGCPSHGSKLRGDPNYRSEPPILQYWSDFQFFTLNETEEDSNGVVSRETITNSI